MNVEVRFTFLIDKENIKQELSLKIQNIIGRQSHNKRNNLSYDYDERLVYSSGCHIVISSL